METEEKTEAIARLGMQDEVPAERQREGSGKKEEENEGIEESDGETQRLVEQVAERLQSGLHIIDTIPEEDEEEEEEEEKKRKVRESQPEVPVASSPGDNHDEQHSQQITTEPAVNVSSTTTPLPNKETDQSIGNPDNVAILDDLLEEVLSKRQ